MNKSNSTLTLTRLREVVFYDPDSGVFNRLVGVANIRPGVVAPRPSKQGYLRMRIDGSLYYLHRLAWFYVHGYWPAKILDHKDGNKENNRIKNIRCANYQENLQNISVISKAESGLRGAYFDKASGKWQAKIMVNYKSISGGYHKTPELAHAAYLDLKNKYHAFQPRFNR